MRGLEGASAAAFAPDDQYDDGYESPEFDLPPTEEDYSSEEKLPRQKKQKRNDHQSQVDKPAKKKKPGNTLQSEEELAKRALKEERDLRVRDLIVASEPALRAAHERHRAASVSEATAWWYIFWVR